MTCTCNSKDDIHTRILFGRTCPLLVQMFYIFISPHFARLCNEVHSDVPHRLAPRGSFRLACSWRKHRRRAGPDARKEWARRRLLRTPRRPRRVHAPRRPLSPGRRPNLARRWHPATRTFATRPSKRSSGTCGARMTSRSSIAHGVVFRFSRCSTACVVVILVAQPRKGV